MDLAEPIMWSGYQCELGEGMRWTGDRLIHVDILAGRLLTLSDAEPSNSSPTVLAAIDAPLGAVAPWFGRPDSWIAAAGTGIAMITQPGELRWVSNVADGAPTPMRMNDGVCDPAGRFWAASMAYDNTPGAGGLYRVDPDGTVTLELSGLTVPNGPAFSPDGTLMYLASSTEGRIDVYTLEDDGSLGAGRQFVQLDADMSPDGMTVDDEGYLWVAIWDGAAVHRYGSDGELDGTVWLPTSRPTSCWFGGADRSRLFITTATYGLDPDDDAAGRVYALDVGVRGPAAVPFG
jgi:sugar lactone lactonase YvrE